MHIMNIVNIMIAAILYRTGKAHVKLPGEFANYLIETLKQSITIARVTAAHKIWDLLIDPLVLQTERGSVSDVSDISTSAACVFFPSWKVEHRTSDS